MTTTCPECGAAVEYVPEQVRVHRAHCSSCGHTLTVLPHRGAPVPEGGEVPATGETDSSAEEELEEEDAEEGATAPPAPTSPFPCPQCGEPLELTSGGAARIEASCAGCGGRFAYALPTARGPPREERGFARGEREEGPPRARPCRECGGPLRFTTNDEGMVEGECSSCGNRFTLPPRGRFGPGGGPRGRGPPGRRFGPPSRGGRGWPRGRGPFRPGGRSFRRPSRDSDEEPERGRDRRRRRDRSE